MSAFSSDLSPLSRLNPYLFRYKYKLLAGLFFVLFTNAFNVYGPVYVAEAIDQLKSSLTSDSLLMYSFLIISMAIGRGVFLFLVRQTIIVVSRDCEKDLRNDLYSHIQKLSSRYYKNSSTGDILARNTNDINAVRSYLGPGIMYSANTIFNFIFIIPIMAAINWQLTLMALLPLPMMSFLVFRMGQTIHDQYATIQSQYSLMTSRVQENLSGIRVVKAYVRELFEIESFDHINREYLRKNVVLVRYQALFYSAMSLLIGLSVVIVVWFGGAQVIKGNLSIGQMTQFVIYISMLIWPMVALGWVMNIIQQAAASQKRLNEILDATPDIADGQQTDSSIREISGSIEFMNVSFGYQPDRAILKNISFKIDKGKVLAITGRTGSGKSTLINLVMRLFDPDSGELFVDGRPIREIPVKILRQHIGYVPQETFLFSDSIRNNISFGVEYPNDDQVVMAAEIASIRENIENFPQQFETFVGERGITLSGGQKQRTAIARALMREPAILILDDCLSAVDTETEDVILSRLKQSGAGRTTIIVAHRISAIRHADLILVIEDGEIAERGTHQELLENNGLYASLYTKQLLEEEIKALN